jgi:hypothetical protein
MDQKKVFIGLPTYGMLVPQAVQGLLLASSKHRWTIKCWTGSLLACGFNHLWVSALNSRKSHGWTHWLLHHGDVETVTQEFLDVMIDEMDRTCAA